MITDLSENIWDEYRKAVPMNSDPTSDVGWKLREQLIVRYLYLAKRVAGSMKKSMPPHVEVEDLESYGKIGLLQAVKRYDHTIGVPFEAFATQRMRSCIMDAIRKADWAPRSLRKKQRDVKIVEDNFLKKEDRLPTQTEISSILEIDVDDIAKIKFQTATSFHAHIEASVEAQNKPTSLNVEEDELVVLMKSTLARSLYELPAKQAAVVALHYYAEKKLAEIAQLLKISDVKIGQIHKEAVLYIWESLQDAMKYD